MTSGAAALRVTRQGYYKPADWRAPSRKGLKGYGGAKMSCSSAEQAAKNRETRTMPDEFPTLEAVAALGVLALLIRTLLIESELRSVPRFERSLARALANADRTGALAACNAPSAPALARSARELIALVDASAHRPEAVLELRQEQVELERDRARRAESVRARDLIVLSVLIGAIAFAMLSSLAISAWFQRLAVLASLLLIVGFVMRVRLGNVEAATLARIADTLGRHLETTTISNARGRSLHSIHGGCSMCGETLFLMARDAELGSALPALSIHELRICKHCGFVTGQAEDAAALGRAALEEFRVERDSDAEASSDDTEHDG